MAEWKCKKSDLVLDDKYFKVRKDLVELPDGSEKTWIYWDSTDSAMVLGITEDKKLVTICQYRYLAGGEMIEFPAGSLKENETSEEAAIREFREESGYEAKNLIKLGSFYETYGQLNRRMHIYFSKEVYFNNGEHDSSDDVSEKTRVELIDFQEAVDLACDNKMLAASCSLAILLLKAKIEKGEVYL